MSDKFDPEDIDRTARRLAILDGPSATDTNTGSVERVRTFVDYPYTSDDTLVHNSDLVQITAGDLRILLAERDEAIARDEGSRMALATVTAERDGWQKAVGEIASAVPISQTLAATGTVGDLIKYLKGVVRERDEARAQALAEAAWVAEQSWQIDVDCNDIADRIRALREGE